MPTLATTIYFAGGCSSPVLANRHSPCPPSPLSRSTAPHPSWSELLRVPQTRTVQSVTASLSELLCQSRVCPPRGLPGNGRDPTAAAPSSHPMILPRSSAFDRLPIHSVTDGPISQASLDVRAACLLARPRPIDPAALQFRSVGLVPFLSFFPPPLSPLSSSHHHHHHHTLTLSHNTTAPPTSFCFCCCLSTLTHALAAPAICTI